MDPIAHTLTGAALAATRLGRTTPLAAAALVLGANVADVDVLAYYAGPYASLALRRGGTHGVLALAVWPFVLTGLLLLWDRYVRRRSGSAPARAGPLLGVAALAVATHPTLDWLNNYGLRWLMPFDSRWFYGDALFIIDPWVWLVLGGALFIVHSRNTAALAAWAVFWLLSSALVLIADQAVTPAARAVWLTGLGAIVAARAVLAVPHRQPALHHVPAAALAIVFAYVAAVLGAGVAARAEIRATLAVRGIDAEQVMLGPTPANPFASDVVAATADAYYVGHWRWLAQPRLTLRDTRIARLPSDAVTQAAASTQAARNFLTWARFPYVQIEPGPAGERVVSFHDARYYDTGRLSGPRVRLDGTLRVLAAD